MSWIETISANIAFVNFPANLTLNPGDPITIRWGPAPPDNGTVADLGNFNLLLRALTGQKYTIQTNVSQALGTFAAKIPLTATGGKGSSSNQFVINAPVVTTTAAATPTDTSTPGGSAPDTGLSGAALAGIIGGVVVILVLVSLIFFCRHRRRVAVANSDNRSMDDNKEAGFTSGPGAYGSKKNQDKESLTKSAGSAGGLADGGMVSIPINGGPAPRRPDEIPRPQQQQQPPQQEQQQQTNAMQRPLSPTRNPFDGPGASPRLNQNQQYQYQPPPAMGASTLPYQQQSDNRESFESELESAYDPKRPSRMLTNNGNHFINSRGPPTSGSPLSHSTSSGSNSSRYPRNMTPQPQNQSQNPFGQENQESLAMAAAAAAAATTSPIQTHRQLQENRSMSPAGRASPRMKEIEMQPLDIQQHHLEQQQKMLQRQQQQQQEEQQSVQPKIPAPIPAAQQSINPTQFDDKAEVEEDDNVAVYNGYRDTIFGHYAPQQGDEDDEEETPIPALPTAPVIQQEQQSTNVVQRKKSVKFTGVPPSGPIVLPSHEAVKQHQAQRQQRQQQQEQPRPLSEAVTEGDDDAYFNEDGDEDEDDIKMRLMETEALSPVSPVSSNGSRPFINTSVGFPEVNALSPVYSPEQSSPYHNIHEVGGYVAPPPPTAGEDSSDSFFGNGFYEDVLAAVGKTSTDSPEPSSPAAATSPTAYRPVMPPVPRSPSPPSSPVAQALPQQAVQQQYIPAPQPQHLQPMNQEVFGAPSPRITPAIAAKTQVLPLSPRSNARPAAQTTTHDEDDDDEEFYETSIL
ncbi:hypothetical protein BGX26_011601 [Mortierella sp. AD094]|nr:hypothetical protein BGX26_011601 [Mortierella sp. AD094]